MRRSGTLPCGRWALNPEPPGGAAPPAATQVPLTSSGLRCHGADRRGTMPQLHTRLATTPTGDLDPPIDSGDRLVLERARLALRLIAAGVVVVFFGWIAT